MKSSQNNCLWGHLNHRRVVLSFALNINSDPNHDFDFEFVCTIDNTGSGKSQLVIRNDDHPSALFEQILEHGQLISLLHFFLIFFLFLFFSGSLREVELDVDLVLNAKLLLDGLPELFDLGRWLELNDFLLASFLNLRTCVNYLTSILISLGFLSSNLVLISEGIYDRNFRFVCRLFLSVGLG